MCFFYIPPSVLVLWSMLGRNKNGLSITLVAFQKVSSSGIKYPQSPYSKLQFTEGVSGVEQSHLSPSIIQINSDIKKIISLSFKHTSCILCPGLDKWNTIVSIYL